MIQVQDGQRFLQFNGRLLGQSSSWRRGSYRWVEFRLYKTKDTGIYILSRVGVSMLYHHPDCMVVKRNKLKEEPRSEIKPDSVPCPECRPDLEDEFPFICPERNRNWAVKCEEPEAVVKSLMKEDEAGALYLTHVAQRLLEEASDVDPAIEQAYRVETIN